MKLRHRYELHDWLAIALAGVIFAIATSPADAGTLFRAAVSVWFVWAGWMDPSTYEAFALRFHW